MTSTELLLCFSSNFPNACNRRSRFKLSSLKIYQNISLVSVGSIAGKKVEISRFFLNRNR